MKTTDIGWTDFSANPLKYRNAKGKVVWGCVKKSAGCANCYAESIAHHYDRGGPFTRATMNGLTPFLDEKELHHILSAKVIDKQPVAGKRCFLGDMTDVFGDWVSDELLDRLFATIALRPDVIFQVLTKRAERMAAYWNAPHLYQRLHEAVKARMGYDHPNRPAINSGDLPLKNLHLGVSVEHQAAADERIPHLLATPAAVRFLSCEPLLGYVDLSPYLYPSMTKAQRHAFAAFGSSGISLPCPLHWCIVGGESGPGHRDMQTSWAESLVAQCETAGVPCFVKQDSGAKPGKQGRLSLDVWQHKEVPA